MVDKRSPITYVYIGIRNFCSRYFLISINNNYLFIILIKSNCTS